MRFQLKRREVIALLGGLTAAGWPTLVRPQQRAKLPTIGFLGPTTADLPVWRQGVIVFAQRLRELGWIEERTVAIEYRWSDGHSERFPEMAADLTASFLAFLLPVRHPGMGINANDNA